MIFFMGSKAFQDIFLENESDDDILDAQYIIVSRRIMTHGGGEFNNIISANATTYPSSYVIAAYNEEEQKKRYFSSLDKNITFFASVIKVSILKKKNIIFICTEKELKVRYLAYLAEYIKDRFDYPVYDYQAYALEIDDVIPYDKKAVLKRCDKIIKTKTKEGIHKIMEDSVIIDDEDEEGVRKKLRGYDKKYLKRIVKDMDFYEKGMSKSEMIETIISFI